MIDYIDKYRGQGGRNSVYDMLRLDPNNESDWNAIKSKYDATPISQIKIDGNLFNNYGAFSFAWEKTYVKQPERSANGTIDNLNSYATFRTPHIVIDFSILSIDDFREIVRLDLEKNEFVVEFYDPIFHKVEKRKMYFATMALAKIYTMQRVRFDNEKWEEFTQIMGVQDYTIELIGTNASLDKISVVYHLNPPTGAGKDDMTVAENDTYRGEEIIIGSSASEFVNETFEGKFKFTKWNVSAENPTISKAQGNYINGSVYTINEELVLYAQWEYMEDSTLSFVYGVAEPVLDANGKPIMNKLVSYGQPIGELPNPQTPVVTIDGANYYPYYGGWWYSTPIPSTNSLIKEDTPYDMQHDSVVYRLYDVMKYKLTLEIGGTIFTSKLVEYNAPLPEIIPYKEGKTFDGWYKDADYKTKFSDKMPPYELTLYGKWVDK